MLNKEVFSSLYAPAQNGAEERSDWTLIRLTTKYQCA